MQHSTRLQETKADEMIIIKYALIAGIGYLIWKGFSPTQRVEPPSDSKQDNYTDYEEVD